MVAEASRQMFGSVGLAGAVMLQANVKASHVRCQTIPCTPIAYDGGLTGNPNPAHDEISPFPINHERLLDGFDVPNVPFDDGEIAALDFGIDALLCERVCELLRRPSQS